MIIIPLSSELSSLDGNSNNVFFNSGLLFSFRLISFILSLEDPKTLENNAKALSLTHLAKAWIFSIMIPKTFLIPSITFLAKDFFSPLSSSVETGSVTSEIAALPSSESGSIPKPATVARRASYKPT